MLKKMLFRGTVMVGCLVASISLLDKLELANNKRNESKTVKDDSNKEDEEFPTEEDVQFMKKLSEMNM